MQRCLRELSAYDCDLRSAGFPAGTDEGLGELFTMAKTPRTKAQLGERMDLNMKLLEALAHQLVGRMYEACGRAMPPAPVPPPEGVTDDLVQWVDYDQRTRPPAEAEPQPEGCWQIR
jgi:hypothetical protein